MGSKAVASASASAAMKVHQFARGLWAAADHHEPSLSLGCKRFRPLAPKLSSSSSTTTTTTTTTTSSSPFDLKSFIRQDSAPRNKLSSPEDVKRDSPPAQMESTHPGGTRWNPTQEQIGILEMLYRGGMRTPNAQQIEQITSQLKKYGKIEGKNVFYWFQNHKARERQKQKRGSLVGLTSHSPRATTTTTAPSSVITTISLNSTATIDETEIVRGEDSPNKRKCRSWAFEFIEEESKCYREDHVDDDRTLELFPLHPEGR